MDIISYALGKKGMQQSVSEYLDEHLTNPANPPIDTSLTIAGAAADAKKTGDEIGDLKEDLNVVSNGLGALEYSFASGKYVIASTGAEGSSANYKVTDYIPCIANGISVRTKVDNDASGICFYDSDKTFISGYNPYNDNENQTVLEIPEGAVYCRISCLTSYDLFEASPYDVSGGLSDFVLYANNHYVDNQSRVVKISSDITYTSGYYINIDGSLTPLARYSYSDLITLAKGETIVVYANATTPNVISMLSKWSSDGSTFLGNLYTCTVSDYETITYTASDAIEYLRICYDNTKALPVVTVNQIGYQSVKQTVFNIDERTSNIERILDGNYASSKNLISKVSSVNSVLGTTVTYADGHIDISGIATGSGGRTTRIVSKFTLTTGAYTIGIYGLSGTFSGLYLENASTNAIIKSLSSNLTFDRFVLASDTECYIGINVTSGTEYNTSLDIQVTSGDDYTDFELPSNVNLIDKTLRNESNECAKRFWAQSMWKVLCIGDSLTSGVSYAEDWGDMAPEGDSIDQNYPRILGRLINGDVTNAGFSGYSASNWYINKISQYDFTDYDTFIIWLGTNNGLTDTLDTDVNPYDDYHDFATTETGYYCKIIEAIKASNNSCLIVLTTVFASKGDADTTNIVIRKIATKYNLPVIDNSDLTYNNYPKLHANVNNPHFGKSGYIYVANRYVNRLGQWFAEDAMRCEYGYSERTI